MSLILISFSRVAKRSRYLPELLAIVHHLVLAHFDIKHATWLIITLEFGCNQIL